MRLSPKQIAKQKAIAELKRRGEWVEENFDNSKYCPHSPTERQEAFLELDCLEALYGGAAGGGKSDALLMAALQHIDKPGYAAILFRRTYADLSLPGALMDRAHDWLRGSDAKWQDKTKTYLFPSGATLTFGYLENEADKYRYQGAEFQFIGFDELTQFLESQFRYLFSRLRRVEGIDVPLRMRGASNPGGVGHEWVKDRFIVSGTQEGRVFVPATVADNPHINREEYERSLKELDPVTRAQLQNGDWEVSPEGKLFQKHWFEIVREAPAGLQLVRYWDLASTEAKAGKDPDYTAGVLMGRSKDNLIYVLDVVTLRATPQSVENLVKQTAELDRQRYGNVHIWMEQEPGSSGVTVIDHYSRKVLMGFTFKGWRETGNKTDRARPLSAYAEAGNVKLLSGAWIPKYLDELSAFPTEGVHDDQVDGSSGAFNRLAKPRDVSIGINLWQ